MFDNNKSFSSLFIVRLFTLNNKYIYQKKKLYIVNRFMVKSSPCCNHKRTAKKCRRKKDRKTFGLPRKFTKKRCLKGVKGFTMKSSCAPYKYCKRGGKKTKKSFLYNPNDPSKSFDVYIDKDPSDTISIQYKTIQDVKKTIRKLEKLYKQGKYSHKRIWQVGMIMYVRLKVLKNKKPNEYKLSKKYFYFLKKRTKVKGEKDRKLLKFKIN